MKPSDIYAVAALLMSLVGVTGFFAMILTDLNLIGIFLLGVGAFLTAVFAGLSIFEMVRRKPEMSRREPADNTHRDQPEAELPSISELAPDIDFASIGRRASYSIAAFALAGIGIGLTGSLVILQFGDQGLGLLLGPSLILLILAAAFIIGPVIGLATGLSLSDGMADGFIGSAAGFIVMMMIVLLLLISASAAAGLGDAPAEHDDEFSDPAFDDPADTPTPEEPPEDNFFLELLQTIIVFSIPTGLVGSGASHLKSRID